ncbi:MAG: DUF1559 domain-containing protein [Gemmataceae bacterium]
MFFEGKTHEEAAKQLGWPRGTVAGRLARARELLRRRLLRRGVAFTVSALLTALAVRPAQAALTGLVHSVIHTARLLTAGQAATAVVSPYVAALAEGVLQAMYWTRMKIFVGVLFVVSLGGAGVTLLATQEGKPQPQPHPPQVGHPPVALSEQGVPAQQAGPALASDDEDEPPPDRVPEEKSPEDASKLARDMARSRLNLKKLALAMHNYNDTYNRLPLAATVGKNGKALLSWRVELLPFIEQQALYNQFKRDEPWNSPHNLKLLSKMPAVYAPLGVKTRRPYSTFYQVFVSAGSSGRGGMPGAAAGQVPGMPGGPQGGRPGGLPFGSILPGGPPRMGSAPGGAATVRENVYTAFVKGRATRIPASLPDGTANTILIVEAGNPVPWTKPEDLHYAEDEPLPELGGLFPNVFHAAFADGAIHTLTKNYSEKQLRYAITANDGMVLNLAKIEARSRRRPGVGGNRVTVETWQRKNEALRKELNLMRQQIRLLKEEQEVERELAGEDPRVNQLKDEHARMQAELKKLHAEIEALKKGIPARKPRREEE